VYSGWAQDYFFKRFGRRGLDDANFEMYVIVHPLARSEAPFAAPDDVALFVNNALYLHPGITLYGEGDGFLLDNLGGALDVVAHEWTHGVTEFSSRLEYFNEAGALNEAFSDIMATGAEFMFLRAGEGPQKGPNFLIGEDVTRVAPGHLRSMENPMATGDPDHYSLRRHIATPFDNGGIHVNCSIVNHAFYLAVAGGTNRVSGIAVQGIGIPNIEQMERIFYRAFVFKLGPLSNFSNARAATLEAASELFGPASNQRAQLQAAWTAVGVL
jgi:thermolysin